MFAQRVGFAFSAQTPRSATNIAKDKQA